MNDDDDPHAHRPGDVAAVRCVRVVSLHCTLQCSRCHQSQAVSVEAWQVSFSCFNRGQRYSHSCQLVATACRAHMRLMLAEATDTAERKQSAVAGEQFVCC
jgi:hypothetical protein